MANAGEFVPPSLAIPSLPTLDTVSITLVSVKDGRPIEIKYVKNGVVVEHVDPRSSMWTVARGPC